MKIIIIGLGNFGASLAKKMTELGHEVIGADISLNKVTALKETITMSIQMDATDPAAISHLPFKDTDVVIIGIGENEGASIMATAVLKQHNVKRIISRAVSPIQATVLEAMGIEEIIHPEEHSAERLAKRLSMQGVRDTYEISGEFNIVEAKVPDRFIGKTLLEAGILKDYNIIVITTMTETSQRNFLGSRHRESFVKGVANSSTVLEEGDIMVVFGKVKDIKRLLDS